MKNLKNGTKKGIFYSLDALMAIVIIVTFLTSLNMQTNEIKNSPINDIQLKEITTDSLFALKVNGALENLINGKKAPIFNFYNQASPSNICFKLTVYTNAGNVLTTETKGTCIEEAPNKLAISRQPLIRNDLIYTVEMKGWYR